MPDIDFHRIYQPAVAGPSGLDSTYVMYRPSPALEPFVRCFWGSSVPFNPHTAMIYRDMLLIPDTCCDLILIKNHRTGRIKKLFVGQNDRYSLDKWGDEERDISVFGIRFPFWAMGFLTKYPMKDTVNQALPPDEIFLSVSDLSELVFSEDRFLEKIIIAERYVSDLIDLSGSQDMFLACTDYMLRHKGVCTLAELAEYVCYSKRQVQRIFLEAAGLPPKRMMDLIRYQSMWQDILKGGKVDYLSLVSTYNYVDQSHLTADFKKYHSMTPRDALDQIERQAHFI